MNITLKPIIDSWPFLLKALWVTVSLSISSMLLGLAIGIVVGTLRTYGGRIVNVGSVLGLRAAARVPAYAASKAGLLNLTRAMAVELARHDIRVNALAPGYIETDLNRAFLASPAGEAVIKRIPSRRFGRLEDLEGPLLLLASPASGYMTGAIIAVDGGQSAVL